MPLPEDVLQSITNQELEIILTRTDQELVAMLTGMEMYSKTHQGVMVNFEAMVEKGYSAKKYRVVVFAYDDGPAREEFPVAASADIEFE